MKPGSQPFYIIDTLFRYKRRLRMSRDIGEERNDDERGDWECSWTDLS